MKNYLIICFVFISQIIFSQTNFERGFNIGFKNGYCFDDYGCFAPYAPVSPTPSIGESYDNYNQGYNRGFSAGQLQKKSDSSQSNQTYNNPWNTPIKFPDMKLYQPDFDFLSSVLAKASQNYQQQQYQQWQYQQQQYQQQQNNNSQLLRMKEMEEKFKIFNSPEARKKRHDNLVFYKNKYDYYKYKPDVIEEGWHKVIVFYGNIFADIPENPGNCVEEWVYVKNNKVVIETDSPDNYKNSDETEYYVPEENLASYKKYMIDNEIHHDLIIDKSYSIFQGVAKIENDILINENGYVKNLGHDSEDPSKRGSSVIFIDYMEKYKRTQESIKLNDTKNQKQKKININKRPDIAVTPKLLTGSNNKPIKRVPGKMQVFPDFIIPSGKFKGQKGSAVKMGDTIRIFYPDGTYQAFLNGKVIPGY